ncbi:hypothetical protein ABT337_30230 [Saccharopolyspora hirsuta]|uniref:Integral membrane protein n=1 Tax=Saccharopolyspora hirsuta TaxID=1837 RepID=A0A5M7BDW4_SACHI|nr:hypothetical protein [Saccharopolyspora hirsuta]KAA5827060.1 hypothetical protein F1721_29165 [Saccharopolyspora hirsuta]
MDQAQLAAPAGKTRAGIVADGSVKALFGAACALGAAPLGQLLGVPVWLVVVSGAVLLMCGAVEIRYVRRRANRTYLRLMVAYDSGWVLATLAGLLLAWSGSGAGGEVWIGYQAVASAVFAALLLAAEPER